jgi:hypothetical protein
MSDFRGINEDLFEPFPTVIELSALSEVKDFIRQWLAANVIQPSYFSRIVYRGPSEEEPGRPTSIIFTCPLGLAFQVTKVNSATSNWAFTELTLCCLQPAHQQLSGGFCRTCKVNHHLSRMNSFNVYPEHEEDDEQESNYSVMFDSLEAQLIATGVDPLSSVMITNEISSLLIGFFAVHKLALEPAS